MPTATYIPLANLTLSSSASEVNFGSIPNTYKDLVLVINGTTSTATNPRLQFNGDTGNLSWIRMGGNGSSTFSSSDSTVALIGELKSSNRGTILVSIMDYSATDKHKTFLSRSNDPETVQAFAGRWGSTSAVNAIKVLNQVTHNFNSGTTFSLYGIAG